MIKIRSLGAKLFLAQATASIVVVAVLAALFWFGLGNGFRDYVTHAELTRLDSVAEHLVSRYNQNENWGFVNQPQDLTPQNPHSQPFKGHPPPHNKRPLAPSPKHDTKRPPPGKPGDILSLGTRLALFDIDGLFINGNKNAKGMPQRELYNDQNTLIGFLSLAPSPQLGADLDKKFLAQQTRSLLISCLIAILISALASAWLARYFRRPIDALAIASRQLAKGDLSARVHLKQDDELGALAQDFNKMAKRLEDFEIARRQWVADTSHELRTPLTILRVQVDALRDGIIPFGEKSLASIESAISDLDNLVVDLYQLARSDIGIYEYKITDVDFNELVVDLQEHFHPALQKANLSLLIPELPTLILRADFARLQQLFSNLLTNSMRYTNTGGSITLSAEKNAGFAEIILDDSPPGVPTEALAKLFERFYRVDASHSKSSGGSGLGLSICQSIIDGLNGSIHAEHSPQGGLRIVIRLPLSTKNQSV